MPGFYETIADRDHRGPLLAVWIIGEEAAGTKALFSQEGGRYGEIFRDPGFPDEIADGIAAGNEEWEDDCVFAERITGGKRLVICGAGHVALCVIRLAAMLGYGTTVIEDREEFAARAREAGADKVVCKPFGEALDETGPDPSAAYVVMTREHAHDVDCLQKILHRPYVYAGMMGSRSRAEQIRQQLLEEGYDARKVEGLHMPIGLPIGSRTPEEIAVSVLAEVISVLNAADPGEGFPPGMAEELAAAEKTGTKTGVLAMIVRKSGEAPRRPGTKMLVRNDGSFLGTVGGGYAEAEILKIAREMIAAGSPENRLVRVSMKKGVMHCGGEITVFMTRV